MKKQTLIVFNTDRYKDYASRVFWINLCATILNYTMGIIYIEDMGTLNLIVGTVNLGIVFTTLKVVSRDVSGS